MGLTTPGQDTFHTATRTLNIYSITGCIRVISKSKTGGYRGSEPFFITLQTGSKFPVDNRNIKDVYLGSEW